nr:MAG TPA: hypothetical protein [Caudoviricetes sp.]
MAKEDEDGVWRTVSGRRIFISNGESLIEAMKKSGKFKKKMHGPNDPKIKKANKPYEKEDAKRAKQYERDQELRKTIQNKKELRKRLEQMKKSGKFKDVLGEPRDTKFGDKKIRNDKEFETTRDAMNAIAKQLNETKDPKQKATLERVLKNYTKNLKEYQQKSKEAFKKKYSESFDNWKKANPQATDDEIIGILKAKQYNGELGGNTKNTIPNRFKDGFKIQNSKYSDENKMTLVEDGSGVRLIYDGKDTGTVLRNDLSDSEISSLRNAGKIQNMSEYLGEKYSLNDKQLRTLHNHLEANIKTWREQGMSNQQILDMVSDRQEIAGDDGLYNLKGIDMNSKKTEVLNEYQSYIQNKISTKTKKDYDAGLEKINKISTDGTYDLETGSSKDYSDGYQVTFSMTDMDFDDKTYQDLVEKFKTHDHGTVDAGKYEGYPEISFNVTDLKTAAKLATKYNQISIWDWKNGKIIPTKGTGAYADYKPVTTQDISKSVARTRGLQNRILNYEDEIKTLKRKSSLTFMDKQKLMKLQREKEKLENQLK